MSVKCMEGAKDKVKRPERSPARSQSAPRFLFFIKYLFNRSESFYCWQSPLKWAMHSANIFKCLSKSIFEYPTQKGVQLEVKVKRILLSLYFLTGVKAFIASSALSNGQCTQPMAAWVEIHKVD